MKGCASADRSKDQKRKLDGVKSTAAHLFQELEPDCQCVSQSQSSGPRLSLSSLASAVAAEGLGQLGEALASQLEEKDRCSTVRTARAASVIGKAALAVRKPPFWARTCLTMTELLVALREDVAQETQLVVA